MQLSIFILLLILIVCIALLKWSNKHVQDAKLGGSEIPPQKSILEEQLVSKQSILDEYRNYLKVRKLSMLLFYGTGCKKYKDRFDKFRGKKYLDARKHYEMCSSLERYLISSYPNFKNQEAKAQLKKELLKHDPKDEMFGKINRIIDQKPAEIPDKLYFRVIDKGDLVKLKAGEYSHEIPRYRYDILRKMGSLEDLFECSLSYQRILPEHQQWSIPLEEYEEYVKQGATVEAFASPFNSQIMRIDESLGYCSLMPIDKKFGSLGNFYEQDFEGKFVIVNPPFTEKYLKEAAEKCIAEVDKRKKCKFVFYGPNWTDAEFYQMLEETGAKKEILKRGEYEYEDLLNMKTIPARFDSVRFTLGKWKK